MPSPQLPPPPPPSANAVVGSDFVVILAALLCALICVLGLLAVARCAWLRRLSPNSSSPPSPPKGLNKKVLNSLPKFTFSDTKNNNNNNNNNTNTDDDRQHRIDVDCAICLAEFVVGEEVRVLPQCGHGFHVVCIDTWLGTHSSCPSCRQILVIGRDRCRNCGGDAAAGVVGVAVRPTAMNGAIGFLP